MEGQQREINRTKQEQLVVAFARRSRYVSRHTTSPSVTGGVTTVHCLT